MWNFLFKGISLSGIGYGQFLFLMELYNSDGIRQEDLSEILNIDKGTTARA
jgi:DNA-binding MarR family transcriptional regulator